MHTFYAIIKAISRITWTFLVPLGGIGVIRPGTLSSRNWKICTEIIFRLEDRGFWWGWWGSGVGGGDGGRMWRRGMEYNDVLWDGNFFA